jgi:hypothetical protein
VEDRLTRVWKKFDTKQIAKVFEEYMESIGVQKRNLKKESNDNLNTYHIDGKATSWNRVQCYHHKDCGRFAGENIVLVLRKRAGNYFIVEKKNERVFEVDHNGILRYDALAMQEIYNEYKPLFDKLFLMAE